MLFIVFSVAFFFLSALLRQLPSSNPLRHPFVYQLSVRSLVSVATSPEKPSNFHSFVFLLSSVNRSSSAAMQTFSLYLLCFLCPPFAILLAGGSINEITLNFLLVLFTFVSGSVIHALIFVTSQVVHRRRARKGLAEPAGGRVYDSGEVFYVEPPRHRSRAAHQVVVTNSSSKVITPQGTQAVTSTTAQQPAVQGQTTDVVSAQDSRVIVPSSDSKVVAPPGTTVVTVQDPASLQGLPKDQIDRAIATQGGSQVVTVVQAPQGRPTATQKVEASVEVKAAEEERKKAAEHERSAAEKEQKAVVAEQKAEIAERKADNAERIAASAQVTASTSQEKKAAEAEQKAADSERKKAEADKKEAAKDERAAQTQEQKAQADERKAAEDQQKAAANQ